VRPNDQLATGLRSPHHRFWPIADLHSCLGNDSFYQEGSPVSFRANPATDPKSRALQDLLVGVLTSCSPDGLEAEHKLETGGN
jgi:hypothetical protein